MNETLVKQSNEEDVNHSTFVKQLAFVVSERQADEASILAQAMREGVRALYQEALIEAYLLGKVSRETALRELGWELLDQIEYQRNALQQDVAWGLGNA